MWVRVILKNLDQMRLLFSLLLSIFLTSCLTYNSNQYSEEVIIPGIVIVLLGLLLRKIGLKNGGEKIAWFGIFIIILA